MPCNSIVKTSPAPPSFLRSSWTLLLCTECSRRDSSGATWFSFSTYQQSDLTGRYHHLFSSRVSSIMFENQVDGSGDLWWISFFRAVETDNKQSTMLKLRKKITLINYSQEKEVGYWGPDGSQDRDRGRKTWVTKVFARPESFGAYNRKKPFKLSQYLFIYSSPVGSIL